MHSFRNHFTLSIGRDLSVHIPPSMDKPLTSIGIKNFWMLYLTGIPNVTIAYNQDDMRRKCDYLKTLGELQYSPLRFDSKGRIILIDEFHGVTRAVISGRGKSLMIEPEDHWKKRVARVEARMAERMLENPCFSHLSLLPLLSKAS